MPHLPPRRGSITRTTRETRISASVDLDGSGVYDVRTGIGFLDHMLEQLSRHSLIDLTLRAEGDLHIDFHHTTEDCGYVAGVVVEHGRRAHVAAQQTHAAPVLEVDGGKDDHGRHRRKLASSRKPAAWIYSGWNCAPATLPRATIAVTAPPYDAVATTSAGSSATTW